MTDQLSPTQGIDFDHASPDLPPKLKETWVELREQCPVTRTTAHGGFWMALGYDEVVQAARDDDTFSSQNDLDERRPGIAIPPMPLRAGIIEVDPPHATDLRKAFLPWFSPGAAESRRAQIQQITDYCIDQIIEKGSCDLTADVTAQIPALLTVQFLGFPPADMLYMADLFHRHAYLPQNTPERDQMYADMEKLRTRIATDAQARRDAPRGDFLSFLANLEIRGERLPMAEVIDNAWLVIAGGVDTTTSLLSNTLIHLTKEPQYRERLLNEPGLMATAFDEYLRFFPPVQGLGRTVTKDCTLGGQQLRENDRLWLLWASGNTDPAQFDEPLEFRIDRSPNRHLSFGIGIHRCIGANIAQVTWSTVLTTVLRRMPDFQVDVERCVRFPTVPVNDGWVSTPATFTPGPRLGAELPVGG
jgi:cytochrome P450